MLHPRQIGTDGTGFAALHTFAGNDGALDSWDTIALSGDAIYGTAASGGVNGDGTLFKIYPDGTSFTNIYTFSALGWNSALGRYTNLDGVYPTGIFPSGNVRYGTTDGGGTNGFGGIIFKLNADGTDFVALHNFAANEIIGSLAAPILAGGELYGTSSGSTSTPGIGGFNGDSGVWSLAPLTPSSIPLAITPVTNGVVLNWTNSSFVLQCAPSLNGAFTNVPDAASPYTNAITGEQQYFRLISH